MQTSEKLVPKPTEVVGAIPATTPFVGPEALERQMGRGFELRLGANESLFGASPLAIEAMRVAAGTGHFYGDPEGVALRTAIAERHGVTIDHVVLGSGIDELLMLFARAYVAPGDAVVTTQGGYPTFDYAISSVGGRFLRAVYRNDRLDLPALGALAHGGEAKMVYVANPDNPSGTWQSAAAIQAFRSELPADTLLMLDEAYADFAPETVEFDADDTGVVRFRTFSKAHGMAGIRVGYAIAHADHIATLNKIRMHFGVSSVAQAGALASLEDTEHVREVVEQTNLSKALLVKEMESMGFAPIPSATNFLTIDMGSEPKASQTLLALREKGVFIRKPVGSALDRCIRVTIGRQQDMERFLELFRQVVG